MAVMDALATFAGTISGAGVVSPFTVTGTNTTVVAPYSYDTANGTPQGQPVDLGKGEDLDLVTRVMTAFTGLTSLEVQYISADDAALTTNVTVLGSSGAIPLASLVAGAQIVIDLPPAQPRTVRRYIGVQYVIVGTGTAGAVYTGLQLDHTDQPGTSYQSGYSIL